MTNDTRIRLQTPEAQDHDPLTAVLQRGAKKLLVAQAIEAEVMNGIAFQDGTHIEEKAA